VLLVLRGDAVLLVLRRQGTEEEPPSYSRAGARSRGAGRVLRAIDGFNEAAMPPESAAFRPVPGDRAAR
jgi:hypothetical protein